MYRVSIALLALAVFGATGCSPRLLHTDHPLNERIWLTGPQEVVAEAVAIDRLAAADVVLLGEEHDNPRHHVLQARVIDALVARDRRPALVFEMLHADQQGAVDRARQQHPNDVDALAEAVGWADTGWPAWPQYRAVFAAAYRHDLPIVAGDLSQPRLDKLRAKGTDVLSPEAWERLGLGRGEAARETETLKAAIREGHCDLLPEAMVPRMVGIQRARDGALSRAALDAAGEHGSAVVITGKGHARSDHAMPRALAFLGPELDVATLAFQSVRPAWPEVGDYAQQFQGSLPFDAVWFTPAVTRPDRCEELRERFGGQGHGS